MKRFGLVMMTVGVLVIAVGIVGLFRSTGEAGGVVATEAAVETTSLPAATEAPTVTTTLVSTSSSIPTTTTTSTTTTTVAPEENETVEEFVTLFAAALADGDFDFVWRRLHPRVIEVGGEDVCRAWVENEIMTLGDYTLHSVQSGPEVVSGIPDVYTASVSFTYQGQVFDDGVGQYALVDGTLRWLGVCR